MKIKILFFVLAFIFLFLAAVSCEKISSKSVIDYGEIEGNDNITTIDILDESLLKGTDFLLHNQKAEGNFNYEYDFLNKTLSQGDNQVRQAGALWGLTLIYQNNPTQELQDAVLKSLQFFEENSQETDGMKYIVYPGDTVGKTGTMALQVLALVDFLRTDFPLENKEKYQEDLSKYMSFLISLRKSDGLFYGRYSFDDAKGYDDPSPYSDGEALLAMVKAYNYLDYEDLKDMIIESADNMYMKHVEKALEDDPDNSETKGFYQWGTMSFYEIYTGDFLFVDRFAQYSIDLAYWMIDVHQTLKRTRNTAYAYEGIISAWELARLIGNKDAMTKFGRVIDVGLNKLISWQVCGPIENNYLKENSDCSDVLAVGGVMNKKDEPRLRIDVTQHQMHVIILARRFVYRD